MISVLIADDQRLFADMLSTIIEADGEYCVKAIAADGTRAVDLYTQHRPDISLIDIQMPGESGLDALKKIKAVNPNAKVILLTTFGDNDHVETAFIEGADGYVLKDITPQALADAMKSVLNGLFVMSPGVREILAQSLARALDPLADGKLKSSGFDQRDIDIMRYIAKGYSNKIIAERMNYSEGTVRNRISALLSATGLNDRTQIALFAIKNRLV